MSYHIIAATRPDEQDDLGLQPSIELCPGLDGEISQEFDSADEAHDALQAEIFHLSRWCEQRAEELEQEQRALDEERKQLVALINARRAVERHL